MQIWIARLDAISSDDTLGLSASLNSEEQARAERFHFERDRRHFMATRGILRSLLAEVSNTSAHELVFERGPHGKPALAVADDEGRALHFNVSHSAGLAMFALTRGREIGVDIEAVARFEDEDETLPQLAARILSPRELEIWQALPDQDARRVGFLRAWTRKEAYIKATGEGLSAGLHTIEVALDAAAPRSFVIINSEQHAQTNREWIVHDLTAPPGFLAALAVEVTRDAAARAPISQSRERA
ncbi:MAG: 4'-phosphopantetheinyl transferase superfamily protein [Verrucomicrobiota bacterium]|nr:4'-phosphopantetheinyl transferase superfamily protein [Verrucomicrobiota bacterium]